MFITPERSYALSSGGSSAIVNARAGKRLADDNSHLHEQVRHAFARSGMPYQRQAFRGPKGRSRTPRACGVRDRTGPSTRGASDSRGVDGRQSRLHPDLRAARARDRNRDRRSSWPDKSAGQGPRALGSERDRNQQLAQHLQRPAIAVTLAPKRMPHQVAPDPLIDAGLKHPVLETVP